MKTLKLILNIISTIISSYFIVLYTLVILQQPSTYLFMYVGILFVLMNVFVLVNTWVGWKK